MSRVRSGFDLQRMAVVASGFQPPRGTRTAPLLRERFKNSSLESFQRVRIGCTPQALSAGTSETSEPSGIATCTEGSSG